MGFIKEKEVIIEEKSTMNKIIEIEQISFKFPFFLGIILLMSSCSSSSSENLNEVIKMVGSDLPKGSSRTGNAYGNSWWTFDGDDLEIEYTAQANLNIEQALEGSGSVHRGIEEYSISNTSESAYLNVEEDVAYLQIYGDWGGSDFYCTLLPSREKSDWYVVYFEVNWKSDASVTCSKVLKEKDEIEEILKIFQIKDKSDELYQLALKKHEKKLEEERLAIIKDIKNDLLKNINHWSDFNGYETKYKGYPFENYNLENDTNEAYFLIKENRIDKKYSISELKAKISEFINTCNLDRLEYLFVGAKFFNLPTLNEYTIFHPDLKIRPKPSYAKYDFQPDTTKKIQGYLSSFRRGLELVIDKETNFLTLVNHIDSRLNQKVSEAIWDTDRELPSYARNLEIIENRNYYLPKKDSVDKYPYDFSKWNVDVLKKFPSDTINEKLDMNNDGYKELALASGYNFGILIDKTGDNFRLGIIHTKDENKNWKSSDYEYVGIDEIYEYENIFEFLDEIYQGSYVDRSKWYIKASLNDYVTPNNYSIYKTIEFLSGDNDEEYFDEIKKDYFPQGLQDVYFKGIDWEKEIVVINFDSRGLHYEDKNLKKLRFYDKTYHNYDSSKYKQVNDSLVYEMILK